MSFFVPGFKEIWLIRVIFFSPDDVYGYYYPYFLFNGKYLPLYLYFLTYFLAQDGV
jgi:hypothetical protein